MTKEEIEHLGRLSRIALTPAEVAGFQKEISSILEYVSAVNAITVSGSEGEPVSGEHRNIFRADEVTTPPGSYTEVLLKAMPATEGSFMKVKKILNQDE